MKITPRHLNKLTDIPQAKLGSQALCKISIVRGTIFVLRPTFERPIVPRLEHVVLWICLQKYIHVIYIKRTLLSNKMCTNIYQKLQKGLSEGVVLDF